MKKFCVFDEVNYECPHCLHVHGMQKCEWLVPLDPNPNRQPNARGEWEMRLCGCNYDAGNNNE